MQDKRLLRRRLVLATLTLGAVFAALGAWTYHGYRGMTLGMWNHWRHATFAETHNLMICIRYWLTYMEKLRFDESTGFYGFEKPPHLDNFEACTLAFHRGEFADAVACLEGELERHGESEERLFWLAMAHLRLAEATNCLENLVGEAPAAHTNGHGSDPALPAEIRHDHGAYCTLPLVRHHQLDASSRRAAELFERLLDRFDKENRLYQWLLSFSAMTFDGFPESVPERYRIEGPFIDAFYGAAARRMADKYAHLSFTDRAVELGVDTLDTGRGVAVEDFDGDGDLDIVTGGSFHTVRFYRNTLENGHPGFVDATAESGLSGIRQPFAITAADYDNDGWPDLFVGRPFDIYRLLRNRGDGTFVDVTEESGLLAVRQPGQVAATWISAWGDVDNDGDLDLFLAQWNFRMPFLKGLMRRKRMDPKLFLNHEGQFTDHTIDFGLESVTRDQYYIGAAFGDYDDDGFPDLYLSSPLRRTSTLLHNEAGRLFQPVDLIDRGEPGFVTAFVDVDHDGRLDIFQSGFSDATSSVEQAVFGEGRGYHTGNSAILRQNADGTFDDHHDFFGGPRMPISTMGSSYGDLDNDGCFDFYLGTGNPEGWFILPNLMYIGRREGRSCTGEMDNVSMLEGFGTLQKGHGIVFFDFDSDGDQDVYSSLGGMWPGDAWPNQLFVNESRLQNAWVKIRLRGRQTNHFGVGARLRVSAEAADGSPIVRHFQMDNKTGFGSAPYLAHVGLLDAVRIRDVEVYWPASGCRHRYGARLGQLNVLDEAACLGGAISEQNTKINPSQHPSAASKGGNDA